MTIRLLVVDDHAILRRGLELLFATTDDIEVVGSAADGASAVEMAQRLEPDVVLMDLSMPDVDGVAATRSITARSPEMRVVVLTSFGDEARILAALNAGYILKDSHPDNLVAGVRAAHAGDALLDARVGRVLLEQRRARPRDAGLTPREMEVLRLLREGPANKQIARRLGITERTVKAHLTSVFAALEVADRAQAATWARDNLPE